MKGLQIYLLLFLGFHISNPIAFGKTGLVSHFKAKGINKKMASASVPLLLGNEVKSINWDLTTVNVREYEIPKENMLLGSSILYDALEKSLVGNYQFVGLLEYNLADNWELSSLKDKRFYVSLNCEEGDLLEKKYFVTNSIHVVKGLIIKMIKEFAEIYIEEFSMCFDFLYTQIQCLENNFEFDLIGFEDSNSLKESIIFFFFEKNSTCLENLSLVEFASFYIKSLPNKTSERDVKNLNREQYIAIYKYALTISKILSEISKNKTKSLLSKELENYDIEKQECIIISKALMVNLPDELKLLDNSKIQLLNKKKIVLNYKKSLKLSKNTLVLEINDIAKLEVEYIRIYKRKKSWDIRIPENLELI